MVIFQVFWSKLLKLELSTFAIHEIPIEHSDAGIT